MPIATELTNLLIPKDVVSKKYFGGESQFIQDLNINDSNNRHSQDDELKLDPTHEKAMFYRGIAKVNLDDEAWACEDWKKAVELGFEDIHGIIDEHCKGWTPKHAPQTN